MKIFNKKYLITIAIIAVIMVGRFFLLKSPSDELLYEVSRDALVDTVYASGTYTSAAQKNIISSANGIISELFVENNDEVRKGDKLFHVESTASDEEVATAHSIYQSALSQLKTSQQGKENADATMWTKHKAFLDSQNNLDLMNDNLNTSSDNPATGDKYTDLEIRSIKAAATQTQKDFQAAEKIYQEADTAIASGYAVVNSSKLAYDATKSITVKAPASGKVVNLLKKTGDEVSASTATLIAPPVLIVANLENPSIIAKVSEAYISRIDEGQRVEIIFDATVDQVLVGIVEAIDTVGTDIAGVVTYDVRVDIENIESSIKPNMSCTLAIETLRKDDVLSVPNSAILFQDEKTYVRVPDKKEDDLIEVELGVKGLVKTEIINGLSEGLEIVANVGTS